MIQASPLDTDTLSTVVAVGIGLAFAIVYGLKWRRGKQRAQAVADVADGLGLRFDVVRDHDHSGKYYPFKVFQRGRTKFAENSMRGTVALFGVECDLLIGDYRAFDRRTNDRFSYLIVRLPRRMPDLLIRPEGVADKLKAVAGFTDLQLGSEDFDRKFHVRSLDEPFAREMLSRDMMQLLHRELTDTLQIDGYDLLLTSGRRRWTPEQFGEQLAFVARFCGHWPAKQQELQALAGAATA